MLNGPCWFLVVLLYCRLYLDLTLLRKYICVCIFILLFLFSCYIRTRNMFIGNFSMGFPLYLMGFCSKKYMSFFENVRMPLLYFLLTFIVVIVLMKYNGPVSMWAIKFGIHSFSHSAPVFYLAGCCETLMIFFLSSFLPKIYILVLGANPFISILGLQSIFIFILDNIIGYDLKFAYSFFLSIVIKFLCMVLHHLVIKRLFRL